MDPMTNTSHWSSMLPLLRWLGYGGLIPFAALAVGSLILPDTALRSQCLMLLQIYGLSIISFVGALSWGIALVVQELEPALRKRLLIWSVMPSLVGCASFVFAPAVGCLILATTAALALVFDLRMIPRIGLPAQWRSLRVHLSLGAIASLLLGARAAHLLAS
jgi:hypothetical protein